MFQISSSSIHLRVPTHRTPALLTYLHIFCFSHVYGKFFDFTARRDILELVSSSRSRLSKAMRINIFVDERRSVTLFTQDYHSSWKIHWISTLAPVAPRSSLYLSHNQFSRIFASTDFFRRNIVFPEYTRLHYHTGVPARLESMPRENHRAKKQKHSILETLLISMLFVCLCLNRFIVYICP